MTQESAYLKCNTMSNLLKTPSLIQYLFLNARTVPRPWWDTLIAGVAYWFFMMGDFISKFACFVAQSPAWGTGAKFATLCGVVSYSLKIGKWIFKTAKDFKNRK